MSRAIVLGLALLGCAPTKDEPAVVVGTTVARDAAIASDAAIDAGAQSLKAHMREHFAQVSELQRAIARGHLGEAQASARWLGDHDEHLLDGWKPYVDELKAAAAEVATARDLPTAAALAARLGRACSRCHDERAAIVSFAWEPAPDDGPALAIQMKRHQWAAARLWDGLVGPSDVLWTEGASTLASTQLDAAAATGGTPRGDVHALAARIRELAGRAATITDHDQRASLYGELLSTCAGCHMLVRPKPVPGP